jgi:hypothetical protein
MRALAVKLAAVATVVVMISSGCKKTINSGNAEKLIGDSLRAHGMKPKVTCPEGVKPKAGDVFTCTVVDPEIGTMTIKVTEKDDQGHVDWNSEGQLIETKDVIAEVKKQAADAQVTCDKRILLLKAGDTYTCPITTGGKTGTLRIKNDDKNNLSWDVQ